MAKKVKKSTKKAQAPMPENALPQNILPMGERVEENKNIYILQSVYKEIHRFTNNKTTNESGGVLVGTIIEELGKTNIVISGFVEAKFSESTPTTLTFTHETWDYIHKEIDKRFKGKKIVGWIHTHPDFGIFLSEYDKFIHQNFFSEDYQVAYVVDPVQHIEGFYFWINGNIEKCRGFYIYDKTGAQINIENAKEQSAPERTEAPLLSFQNIMIAILAVAVVFLIFANISTNEQLKDLKKLESSQEKLEAQQYTLTESANQVLGQIQQLVLLQGEEIQFLRETLTNAGFIVEPEPEQQPEGTEDATDPTDGTTDTTVPAETTDSTEPTETEAPANA